jgi:predicted alpha/beta-fold hydrolase
MNFRPLPLLGNAHLQTILGQLSGAPRITAPTRAHRVPLDDGDALLLHDSIPPRWRRGDPVALIIHGLGGSAVSGYCLRFAVRFLEAGMRAVRIDLRGAGQGVGLARQFYHAGRTEDLRAAIAALGELAAGSPVFVVAVSLGGNAALKLAGELGGQRTIGRAPLAALAVLAPPIDLARSTDLLEQPRNRLYQVFFVRLLARQARLRQRHFPDLPSLSPRLAPVWPLGVSPRMTMREFDDLYTAPRCGFASADDYYARASAAPWLTHIQTPTLLVTSRDDPFIDDVPFRQTEATLPAAVRLHVLDRGGHAGFLGDDGNGSVHWVERVLTDWTVGRAARGWDSSDPP